jgi:serine phosphatase RsbU (regulator of sigma subunit)
MLLRYIAGPLGSLLGWTTVYLDLQELRATTQQAFFANLSRMTEQGLAAKIALTGQNGASLPHLDEKHANSVTFRAFLSDCLAAVRRDLVLIIDPLEALPTDLVQSLLTSLRAAYMDQQDLDYRLTVVVSGALSLATLAVGESSPFRGIARRVFIGDLSESDSLALIQDFLVEDGASATRRALDKILQATRGDVFLIRRISQRSAELLRARGFGRLRARDVDRTTSRFLRQEVFQYAPLVEAIRLIEDDPDLLHCILRLLEEEAVPRAELPLPLSPDLDPLYLTGVVENVGGDTYRVQNTIYRQFLSRHFSPGRVGHVLAMAGRWDSAIDYLESSIQQGYQASRADLLPATVNSIYAAQDLTQAVHFLRRGLSAAFGVGETRVWFRSTGDEHLRLVGLADPAEEIDLNIPIGADRLEARAFRYQVPLRGQEGESRIVRAIPLRIPGGQPIGVATVYEELLGGSFSEQRERDLHMAGFLNQAARALQAVSMRRQELVLAGRVQASLLPEAPPVLSGWQIAAAWQPARETSGDFYDFVPLRGGQLGLVMGDVVDKGFSAALLMALIRTLIRTYALEDTGNPAHLLQTANRRLLADLTSGQFVTLFYGVLDPASGLFTYCNAGHPPPYLFTPGEDPVSLPGNGRPVGVADDSTWQVESIRIPPKSLLLLYTDGVLDAQNSQGKFFGKENIIGVVRENLGAPAGAIQEALLTKIFTFAGVMPQMDDIAVMVLLREEKRIEEKAPTLRGSRYSYQRRYGVSTVS